MRVTVKFFAGFREGRFKSREIEFPGPPTVAAILERYAISPDAVGVVLCNGRHVDFSHRLADGETCSIFPKVGGG